MEERDPLGFLPGVAEKLGWYVYALRDPRNNSIFYVGKGKGDRVYAHARQARKVAGEPVSRLKLAKIHEIHRNGREVGVEIVRHQIASEDAAYDIEAAVIDALRLVGASLTNLVAGHETARGWMPLEEIIVRYLAKPVTVLPEHRVLLINIRNEFPRARSARELYEATRKWWVIRPEKRRPEYAFALYHGIVRAVYHVRRWEEREDGRRGFRGSRAREMEEVYIWKDLSGYLPHGAQNPIKYVNC